jgi:serine/threonine protein kinase
MPPERTEISPENWIRVQALFEALMESDNPASILEHEADREVAEAARRLWRNHQEALENKFLDDPVALLHGLPSQDQPRFSAGQVLAGRFAIEKLLGIGGMGEVYLAHDQRLGERVAIKTIRRRLAGDTAVRRRFLAEIQNARRVTHPNVCRIFDLSDEGETPFFSMEYLEGLCLAEWLQHGYSRALARRVALQLAEGLDAAHRNAIVHCDFKPANVILTGDPALPRAVITDFGLARAFVAPHSTDVHSIQGGTLDYMAPELRAGAPATVRSDIYAFGKVLAELIGGNRLAAACQTERPEDRPKSLAPVIDRLRGGSTRRLWISGAVALPFASFTAYELLKKPRLPLLSRQRLAINGFRPAQASHAVLLRDLLITGLRQSLLVTVVPDQRIRSILGKLKLPDSLPVDRSNLLTAAAQDGISLIVEGTLRESGQSLGLLLQVFQPGRDKPALQLTEQTGGAGNLVQLADRVALQLRREFGESSAALKSASLEQVTSRWADAVEYYFHGVRLYEGSEAEAAIVWFNRAIGLDPQFALAHLYRGLALAARFEVAAAIPSYQAAFDLRGHVSERERLWIESRYYNITGDYVSSLDACRRLVALYPDEPTFQRNTAFEYAATGRPRDALPYNRRAVELDLSNNNISELIVNHAEANLCDEALALYQRFRAEGYDSTLLDWGDGLAWMGKGEYHNARLAFERMGQDAKRDRWSRWLCCAPWILEGRFADAAAALESDLAWDIAMHEQNHRLIRQVWLGNLELLMDAAPRALLQAEELVRLPASPVFLQPLREGALLALELKETHLARVALEQLKEIEREWPSTHSRGARAHVEGALLDDPAEAGALIREAVGLWGDPLILLTQAQWLARQGDFNAALAACDALDQQRGRILKRYFPGLVVLGWIQQGRCLVSLSRFDDARRVYQRIERCWLRGPKEYRVMRQVRDEFEQISRNHKGEAHG